VQITRQKLLQIRSVHILEFLTTIITSKLIFPGITSSENSLGLLQNIPLKKPGFSNSQLVTGVFPRKVVWNKINTPLGTVNVFNTHLSFNSGSVRTIQVQQIISYIESIEPNHPAVASILTGDFNDTPYTTSIQQLTNTGTDTFYVSTYAYVNPGSPGYTVPSNAPTSKIDYVFLKNTGSIAPFNSSVVMNQPYSGNNYCSDHLGVLTYFTNGTLDVDDESSLYPDEFKLFQNYPNPFNPNTKISWQSPVSSWQTLKVYDSLGNEIATLVNEEKPVGKYEVEFTGNGLPSGIYFYRLQAGDYTATKKLILMK